jgi:hypothetical protein
MNEKPSDDLSPLLEQAAKNLIQERILNKVGKQPSQEAVDIAARLTANKAIREGKLAPPQQELPVNDAVSETSQIPSPKPLRQPSPKAIEVLAKMMVNKGVREGKLLVLPEKG